ncbi:hypothetical protein C1I63_03535 [Rathayibacter caricis DSM 15933]|uniref:Calcineurin-like phosphoesterase domain-containing protein n=1 Tax=Rathayibacter caricis DSM 15933 TaxID=1328867 RepID=A0A2T4UR49_9MICO|nr:metallophosphoesterase [Rathayibacter caricis]PTL71997.1 hypothetical protein C1I63_03535 [Rathayibacter caricis DSM 15933]
MTRSHVPQLPESSPRTVSSLAEALTLIEAARQERPLLLVGVTGSPGSGKSTLAEHLRRRTPGSVVLPLDGYHLPQERLRELGRGDRMGAPDTFDAQGFVTALRTLRSAPAGSTVSASSFDRAIEEPVPGALSLPVEDGTVVLVEGNYLLLRDEGWEDVSALLDLRIHLRVPETTRRARLVARHLRFGKTLDEAIAWTDGPDERNARRIEAAARFADVVLEQASERPLRLLHLSDTHLLADPAGRYNRILDTRAGLEQLLAAHDAVEGIDAVVVSGDLADDGAPASYSALRGILAAWCAARGAELVLALGNHDDREGFGSSDPRNTATTVRGVRILTLDSSVPGGASWGLLTEPTLAWLRERIAEDPDAPVVIVLHHPPIEAVAPLHTVMGLVNPHDLWEAASGGTVLAVLAGHWHHAFVDTTGPAPVVVAPGAANRTDVLAGPRHERSVAASGASVIDVSADGVRVTSTEIDSPHRGAELFDVSGERLADAKRRLGFPGYFSGARQN